MLVRWQLVQTPTARVRPQVASRQGPWQRFATAMSATSEHDTQLDIKTKPPTVYSYSRYDDELVKTPRGWLFKARSEAGYHTSTRQTCLPLDPIASSYPVDRSSPQAHPPHPPQTGSTTSRRSPPGLERRPRGASPRARRLRRHARRDRAPGRDDAAAGRRLAGRLRADRQQRRSRLRRVRHLGSRHGSVSAEPRRGRAPRARARRRRSARRCCRRARSAGSSRSSTSSSTACAPTASKRSASASGGRTACSTTQAAARGEADALLARPLRDRREQGARLPDDAPAERDVPRARRRATSAICSSGILKDPAMLVYLDNGENVKTHPNENFGRELLELFTMGVGNYTERDVREAARAFTGWTNDVLDVQVRRGPARLRREDVPRPDRTVQRRGHHRHHPRSSR